MIIVIKLKVFKAFSQANGTMYAVTTYIWRCLWSEKSRIVKIPAYYHWLADVCGWEAQGSVEIIGLRRNTTFFQLYKPVLSQGYVSSGILTYKAC